MAQSLASLHIHLVFSSKNRAAVIRDGVRDALHGCMAQVLKNIGCSPILINSMDDHVHILFDLARTAAVSRVVEEVKKSSSRWMKTQGVSGFSWQSGYGAFAVSRSRLDAVRKYVAEQHQHHQKRGYQDELRQLLVGHQIEFDERYIWD
jgi:REP element-mobilizing transposase RayT